MQAFAEKDKVRRVFKSKDFHPINGKRYIP
jgi:hypothetical protein